MKTYEAHWGEDIKAAANRMVALADSSGETVKTTFNDIELMATPGSSAEAIADFYSDESERRHQAYIDSPEYKERQRQAEEEQRSRDLAARQALASAPETMALRDTDGWARFAAANADDYGSGVIRFADRWARLMEARMQVGETLEACAKETSQLAHNEGITGYMYGCAVSILAKVWVHGEALRRWHNLKTQIRDEGEKANESGGVLNPALITIGAQ